MLPVCRLTPATSVALPRLHWDWARRCHICTATRPLLTACAVGALCSAWLPLADPMGLHGAGAQRRRTCRADPRLEGPRSKQSVSPPLPLPLPPSPSRCTVCVRCCAASSNGRTRPTGACAARYRRALGCSERLAAALRPRRASSSVATAVAYSVSDGTTFGAERRHERKAQTRATVVAAEAMASPSPGVAHASATLAGASPIGPCHRKFPVRRSACNARGSRGPCNSNSEAAACRSACHTGRTGHHLGARCDLGMNRWMCAHLPTGTRRPKWRGRLCGSSPPSTQPPPVGPGRP